MKFKDVKIGDKVLFSDGISRTVRSVDKSCFNTEESIYRGRGKWVNKECGGYLGYEDDPKYSIKALSIIGGQISDRFEREYKGVIPEQKQDSDQKQDPHLTSYEFFCKKMGF